MSFLIGLLTAVLVLDCLVLIFLVLIQLPKKEAGAGLAFGGGATDALFGAGSGNVLTRITQYAAGVLFVLTVAISILNGKVRRDENTLEIPKDYQLPVKAAAAAKPAAPVADTNGGLLSFPAPTASNAPATK